MASYRDILANLRKRRDEKRMLSGVPQNRRQSVERAAQQKSYYQKPDRFASAIREPFSRAQQAIEPTLLGRAATPMANAYKGTWDFGKTLGTAVTAPLTRREAESRQALGLQAMRRGDYQQAANLFGQNEKEYARLGSFTPERIAKGALSTLTATLGTSQPLSGRVAPGTTGRLAPQIANNVGRYGRFAVASAGLGGGIGAGGTALSQYEPIETTKQILQGKNIQQANKEALARIKAEDVIKGGKEGAADALGRSLGMFGNLQGTSAITGATYGKYGLQIQKALSKVPGLEGNKQLLVMNRVIPSAINVIEGLALDRALDLETDAGSILIDAITGLYFKQGSVLPDDFGKIAPDSTPRQRKAAANTINKSKGITINGNWFDPKTKTYKYGPKKLSDILKDQGGFAKMDEFIPKKGSIEQVTEAQGGWKPGQRQEFDTALFKKDADALKKLIPDVPKEYVARFQDQIDAIIKPNVAQPPKSDLSAQRSGEAGAFDPSAEVSIPKSVDDVKKILNIDQKQQPTKEIDKETSQKIRSLVDRMKQSSKYPKDVKEMLEGSYTPITNKKTIETAKSAVLLDPQLAEIRAKNPQNALDMALGAELFNKHMADGNVAKANEIINSTAGTNEGQMIQILSNYDKTTPFGAMKFAQNAVDSWNKTHPNKMIDVSEEELKGIYKEAKKIQKMDDGRAKDIASHQLHERILNLVPSTITDKAITLWKAGLLTSLRTHERNLIGNTLMQGSEVAKDYPASIADRLMAFRTGQRSLKPTVNGLGEVFSKGTREQIIDMNRYGFDPNDDIGKYDVHHITWGDNGVEQALKKYTDVVFRTLASEDKPFWNASFARSLYDQAAVAAENAGKAGDEKFIKGIVNNPTTEMKALATREANYSTFHDSALLAKLVNNAKQYLSKNQQNSVARAMYTGSEVLAPFTGVPTSILGKFVDYSPIGFSKGTINVGRVLVNNLPLEQRVAAQQFGRGALGTALYAAGYYLYSNGLMTGNPEDAQEARQWDLEGKQRNSVLVNGKWRSINSIGPQTLILLAGAKLKEAQEDAKKEGKGIASALTNTIGSSAKDFTQQSLLAGIQQPLNVLTDPERYKASRYAGQMVASGIPNIIKDVSKSADPYVRENNTFMDQIQNAIPLARNANVPMRDVFGERITQNPSGAMAFIDLFNSRPERGEDDVVVQELSRLNYQDQNATPSKLSPTQTINGVKMTLNPQQLDRLEQKIGPAQKQAVLDVISTAEYQMVDNETKKDMIRSATAKARKDVRDNFNPDASLYEQSDDAPKTRPEKAKLLVKSAILNPIATKNFVETGQPLRKLRTPDPLTLFNMFDAITVAERKKGLSGLDAGNRETQVDHTIPLWAGGGNDPDNLRALTNEDHTRKTNLENRLREQYESGQISLNQVKRELNAFESTISSVDLPESDKKALSEGKLSFDLDGKETTLDINDLTKTPKNRVEEVRLNKEKYKYVSKVLDSEKLSDEQKAQLVSDVGIEPEDAFYYDIAREDNEVKSAFIMDEIDKIVANEADRGVMLQFLGEMRRSVNGEKILANGVIDDLYDAGLISSAEKKKLKDLDYDEYGNVKLKTTGRGRSAKIKSISYSGVQTDTKRLRAATGGRSSRGFSQQDFARLRVAEPELAQIRATNIL